VSCSTNKELLTKPLHDSTATDDCRGFNFMEKEIWKPIPNYEGLYVINNFGRIIKLPIIFQGKLQKEKYVSLMQDNSGYHRVCLTKNGCSKNTHVHVLMAITFLDFKPNGHEKVIDHIDNNKLNNSISNLQIITHRENISKDRNTKSGLTGVYKSHKKYMATITINKKRYYLGVFETKEEAHKAYLQKLNSL
jgi:hypothetical protein